MKKRITGILMCAMMLCLSLLTGCSLVETNYKNYYTQTVAAVEKDGHRYEISKRDLMYAYQTTGYQYVQYGMTKENAYKQMLSSLENTKILVDTAEKTFDVSIDGKNLSEKEKTYLYSEVVDALKANFDVFYDDIVGDENKVSSSDDSVKFNGYTKNASYDAINKTIIRENKSTKLLSSFTYTVARDINKSEDKELIYENFVESLKSEDQRKAYSDYFRNLKANEYGLGLTTGQKDVFMREIDRLYKSVYETYVCAKYNESILDDNSTNVTPIKIANLYASKVRAGYTQYVIEQDSNYDSSLSSSLDKMYYFKEGATDNKYFTVANILIKFDDDQQAEYDKYTKKYESENDGTYTYADYQSDIAGVYNKLQPLIRVYNKDTEAYDGEKSETVSVEEVYTDISSRLANAQATGDINKVGDAINELIYEYNEDPGMLNATNNYVIGVDKDGKLVSNSFVESFNDGAIELYNKGNAKVGDVSGYVKTSYGIHILVYTGACKNLFDGIDSNFSLSEDALQVLYTTRVNPLVDKTYFDVMYDEIYNDNSTSFQQLNLSVLKQDYKIYEYPSRFEDLLK